MRRKYSLLSFKKSSCTRGKDLKTLKIKFRENSLQSGCDHFNLISIEMILWKNKHSFVIFWTLTALLKVEDTLNITGRKKFEKIMVSRNVSAKSDETR